VSEGGADEIMGSSLGISLNSWRDYDYDFSLRSFIEQHGVFRV
jgi:hypothetical protein